MHLSMPRLALRALLTTLSFSLALTSLSAHTAAKGHASWVAATPDALIARSRDVAIKGGADGLARLILIASLNEDAGAETARAALRAVAARSYPPVGEHRDPAAAAVLGGEVLDPAREHAEPLVGDGAPAQGVVGVGVVPGAHDDEIGFEPSAGSGARQASIALAGKQNQ